MVNKKGGNVKPRNRREGHYQRVTRGANVGPPSKVRETRGTKRSQSTRKNQRKNYRYKDSNG